MSEPIIRITDLTKDFYTYTTGHQKVMHRLFGMEKVTPSVGLTGVSLTVERGEKIALIGNRGSGRSTFMRILAGLVPPTSGKFEVNGEITPYFSHQLGFDMALPGRDNLRLRARLRGWSKKEVAAKEQEIIDFADLADIIDMPMKTYRGGTAARLGFTIDTTYKPDILLYDCFFGFGTAEYTRRCLERFYNLMDEEVTLLMTLSNIAIASKICTRGLVLHEGALVFDGALKEALKYYKANCRPKTAAGEQLLGRVVDDNMEGEEEENDSDDSMGDVF